MGGPGSKGGHRICEICGIQERRKSGISFFTKFPLDESRCKEWLRVVGIEELVYLPIEKLHQLKHICGNHFERRDFNKKGNRLKRYAIPSINLTAVPLTDEQLKEFPQHIWKRESDPFASPAPSTSRQDPNILTVPVQADPPSAPSTSRQESELPVTDATSIRRLNESFQLSHIDPFASPAPSTSRQDPNILTIPVQADPPSAPSTSRQESELPVTDKTSIRRLDVIFQLSHIDPFASPAPSTSRQDQNILTIPVQADPLSAPSTSRQESELITRRQDENVQQPHMGTEQNLTSKNIETVQRSGKETHGIKRKFPEQDMTPRKKKLIEQLRKTKCNLRTLKRSAKLVENIESPVLKEMVLNTFKNQNRPPKGRRWTKENKISALAIFKRSPKTYRYLNQIIPLPSEKTLQNILKKVPMQPGINRAILQHLHENAEQKDFRDRMCCLLFDEMAIKQRLIYNVANDIVEGYEDLGEQFGRTDQLADHALVFMLQGIRIKYKQPIAFYFVKGTISSQKLASIIITLINDINATGYKVLSTVCDQGPTNLGALKILRDRSGPVTDGSNNYFKIDNEKVFIIFDVPHLFKSVRNNFMKNGTIMINNEKAEWSHIREVELKNRNFLYLSKISQIHVDPKYRAKMKVKYAAQILSNTVSAVLKLLSQAENDSDKGKKLMQSAIIIQDLDRLFDCTNGPSCPDDIKKGQRENVSLKTYHLDRWAEWIIKMRSIKFLNDQGVEAKNIKCIDGYIMTLKSLRDIWQFLSAVGFKYLNLRQLNQDALENLFGLIRQHSPTNRNPTCAHFIAALKTGIITNLSTYHSRGSNCQKDNKILLTDFHKIIFDKENKEPTVEELPTVEILENPDTLEEYPLITLPEEDLIENDLSDIKEQPTVYVSGYLAYVICKKNKCMKCIENLKTDNINNSGIYNYILLREWWKEKKSLTYPTETLCHLVQSAVTLTETELCPRLHEKNICELAITLFSTINTDWYSCQSHKTIIFRKIFSRLGLLFIRRQCQRINENLAIKEERMADANKKAQQSGNAK